MGCALPFYVCFIAVVGKHDCLPTQLLHFDVLQQTDYADVFIYTEEPLYAADLTTTTTQTTTVHRKILEKEEQKYLKRPNLVTGLLYPVGYYVAFPDLKGIIANVTFYCNMNTPIVDNCLKMSHHYDTITKKDETGHFVFEQRDSEVKTGDIIYCRLDLTQTNNEVYSMHRRFGIFYYKTTTDSEYVGGLIG